MIRFELPVWLSQRKRYRRLRLALVLVTLVLIAASGVDQASTRNAQADSKTIAMIGAGHMGQALGNLWAAAGYHVIFATRHPNQLGDVVRAAGHGAQSARVGKAVERAGIVALAVPYRAEASIAKRYGDHMRGKVLVDVDNAFAGRDGAVAKKAEALGEAVYSARLFKGTRFIRTFNLKGASSYPKPGAAKSADYDMPYTTNDPSVRPIAEALIRAAGGTPRFKGDLSNAGEY